MSIDILTVPDDLDELEKRFGLLFPQVDLDDALRYRPQMVTFLLDHNCSSGCLALYRHPLAWRDALPAEDDFEVASPCWDCGAEMPWSDVVSGASLRADVDGRDVRLCAKCTAERAR